MEAMKGRYLRPEHDPDDDLREIGVKIRDRTKEVPMDAHAEPVEDTPGFLKGLKYQALFLALVIGIGICRYFGLMDDIIAAPGMCVCAACFGWNVRGCR